MPGQKPRLAKAINTGITTQLNQLGQQAGCQPLEWRISHGCLSGHAGREYAEVEAPDVLAGWAAYLGLTRQERPVCAGSTEYRGRVGGLDVEVWGVHDRDAFDRETERDTARRRAAQNGGSR